LDGLAAEGIQAGKDQVSPVISGSRNWAPRVLVPFGETLLSFLNSLRERAVSFAISGALLFALVFVMVKGSTFGVSHAGVVRLDLPDGKIVGMLQLTLHMSGPKDQRAKQHC